MPHDNQQKGFIRMNKCLSPPSAPIKNGIMVIWKNQCYRSSSTARTFRIPLIMVCEEGNIGRWLKPFSYTVRIFRTLRILLKEKPKTIICLNLPVFLPMACQLYSLFMGAHLILDFHSGAITHPIWRRFIPYYRYLVPRSPFTLCHNYYDGSLIAEWGGRPVHMLALPDSNFPEILYTPPANKPLFFFSCSYSEDEPIELALSAMRKCTNYNFIISGNYKKRGIEPSRMPDNICLAGFLEYQEYIQIMARSTAVLTLSKRSYIMQMAVEEALTLGVPVVTNKSPAIMELIGNGGVYTDLDADALANGLKHAVENHSNLVKAMNKSKSDCYSHVLNEINNIKKMNPYLFQ